VVSSTLAGQIGLNAALLGSLQQTSSIQMDMKGVGGPPLSVQL
jgi:hypothetical protein